MLFSHFTPPRADFQKTVDISLKPNVSFLILFLSRNSLLSLIGKLQIASRSKIFSEKHLLQQTHSLTFYSKALLFPDPTF